MADGRGLVSSVVRIPSFVGRLNFSCAIASYELRDVCFRSAAELNLNLGPCVVNASLASCTSVHRGAHVHSFNFSVHGTSGRLVRARGTSGERHANIVNCPSYCIVMHCYNQRALLIFNDRTSQYPVPSCG